MESFGIYMEHPVYAPHLPGSFLIRRFTVLADIRCAGAHFSKMTLAGTSSSIFESRTAFLATRASRLSSAAVLFGGRPVGLARVKAPSAKVLPLRSFETDEGDGGFPRPNAFATSRATFLGPCFGFIRFQHRAKARSSTFIPVKIEPS